MWPFSHENFHKISDAKESDIAKQYIYVLGSGEHPYMQSDFKGGLISGGTLPFKMFGPFGSVWCKTALAEVGLSLP